MRLTFLGATGTVTGSQFLVETAQASSFRLSRGGRAVLGVNLETMSLRPRDLFRRTRPMFGESALSKYRCK